VQELVERRSELEVLRLVGIGALGADAIVTTRVGGVSDAPYDTLNLGDHVGDDPVAVRENRRRLAVAMGVSASGLAVARQVHGTGVVVVHRDADLDALGDADMLVTTDDAIALCILVADCVPIVVVDPIAKVLCVAHAGWRGTASRVAVAAVEAMTALGAQPARCHAAMGPCISARAYQVGDEVAEALCDAGSAHAVVPDGTGRFLADLAGAQRTQLVAAGLCADHVTPPTSWTDGGKRFFSDRAERPCGRFALTARLRSPAS
jgi:polyphenol oxidase